jgi:hypothetical protein
MLPRNERAPPLGPPPLQVNYTFTLPYTARIQQPALSYPVAFYRDGEARRVRMDTYDSTQVMIAKKVGARLRGWCAHLLSASSASPQLCFVPQINCFWFARVPLPAASFDRGSQKGI